MVLRLGAVRIILEIDKKSSPKKKVYYTKGKIENNNNSNIFVEKNSTENISNIFVFPNR